MDIVNSPKHYAKGNIECIQAIRAALTPEEFRGYLRGNMLKYLWRYDCKDSAIVDLKKAEWYLKELLFEVAKADKQV